MFDETKVPRMKTINEAAAIVGLSKYFVRKLVLDGMKIKFVKAGNKFLINLDSLIDYLNKGDLKEMEFKNDKKIRKIEQ